MLLLISREAAAVELYIARTMHERLPERKNVICDVFDSV